MDEKNPQPPRRQPDPNQQSVPIDVALVIQIVAGCNTPASNRRKLARCPFVVLAQVELKDESPKRRWIYTRDANERGGGFISQEQVPQDAPATLHITVAGEEMALPCVLKRCRKVLPDWFEGAAILNAVEPRLAWREMTRPHKARRD